MDVEKQIAEIRQFMPETYKAIQAKAAVIGKPAYGLVRRALKGEANCFYAVERGRVVGVPFTGPVMADVALQMVQFGCSFLCVWPEAVNPQGAT